MIDVDARPERRQRPEALQIGEDVRVVADLGEIALEQAVIGKIEADQGDEGADVGLGQALAQQVATIGQTILEQVEGDEDLADRALVGALPGRKARPVDAVVEAP